MKKFVTHVASDTVHTARNEINYLLYLQLVATFIQFLQQLSASIYLNLVEVFGQSLATKDQNLCSAQQFSIAYQKSMNN